ncbi:hypothetical protein [Paracoccus indicus]|uniref:hypothetical protein n=1 Tax=Paracoccus indicus TaxID=2079229 RepID=UPI0013B36638|nr:hypothetical protein [Paracoccus indicus]
MVLQLLMQRQVLGHQPAKDRWAGRTIGKDRHSAPATKRRSQVIALTVPPT